MDTGLGSVELRNGLAKSVGMELVRLPREGPTHQRRGVSEPPRERGQVVADLLALQLLRAEEDAAVLVVDFDLQVVELDGVHDQLLRLVERPEGDHRDQVRHLHGGVHLPTTAESEFECTEQQWRY